jgi:hypothetical protein
MRCGRADEPCIICGLCAVGILIVYLVTLAFSFHSAISAGGRHTPVSPPQVESEDR